MATELCKIAVMPPEFRKCNILMVDDDPGDAALAERALEMSKVPVAFFLCHDGAEGLEFLNRKGAYADAPRPDFMILDLNMPRMNGFEMIELVRQDAKYKKIPIVVLTTSSDQRDIDKAYELGANSYVTKPLELNAFEEVVLDIEEYWNKTARKPSGSD